MKTQAQAQRLSDCSPTNSMRHGSQAQPFKLWISSAVPPQAILKELPSKVMSGPSDVATKLHELATVISHHSEIANERVAAGVFEKGARRF